MSLLSNAAIRPLPNSPAVDGADCSRNVQVIGSLFTGRKLFDGDFSSRIDSVQPLHQAADPGSNLLAVESDESSTDPKSFRLFSVFDFTIGSTATLN
jgi:hypothetical protein